MATLIKSIDLDAPAEAAWALLGDPGAAAKAFPGVLTESRLDGDVRTVMFAGGMMVKERIVTVDPQRRRIAYGVIEGRFSHHSASMQVEPTGEDTSRMIWTCDLLPEEAVQMVGPLMDQGLSALSGAVKALA